MSSTEALELVRRVTDALTSAGLVVDDIDLSGELVRCGTTQKPNGTDGAYKVHTDFPPSVWLCNYHGDGEGRTVPLWEKGRIDAMTEAEREALRECIRQGKEENARRLEERRRQAAEAANALFRPLPTAGEKNPYLNRKGVSPMGGLRECDASQTPFPGQLAGACLVVPLLNSEGRTVSLQFIDGEGRKRFLPGGEKKGCYFPIPARDGSKAGPLLIGEGTATVLSACMATGHAGLVAFDAGNLEAVAKVARETYPERELVLLADNDCTDRDGTPRTDEQNAGLVAARKAAEAVGGKLAVCPAHEGRATDFNDLHQARGLDAVRMVIEKAREEACASPLPGKDMREAETGREDSPVHFLPPPPPVPLEAFPPEARALLTEAADAFTVPLAIPAATLLALLSCMVGRTRCVEVKSGWKEHGNIWIVLVASSGMGKTPVMNAFFQPVEAMERRRFKEWKEALEEYNRDWMDYTRAKKEERGLPPKKPLRTQYYLDESTVEALADALEQNPRGVMWRVDELSGLLSSFDKYSSGKEGGTRARLLSAYDCQSWKSNRRNEERNLHIPAACVSIFGGLQPGMMRKSFDGSDEDSGFLPRFMFIRAERERASLWSEETLSPASYGLLRGIAEHLSGFGLNVDERSEGKPCPVGLSSGGKSLFVGWYNDLAREDWALFAEGTVNAVRQKLKGLALRLCLLLHCLDAAISGGDGLNLIPEDTMRRALLLAEWVKENQIQTLTLLREEKTRPSSPVERAIMESLVADAERIEADGWKIVNSRLVEMVNGRLPVEVKPEQIGKAASALGLALCKIGGKGNQVKARIVTSEKLEMFRTTVLPVIPVIPPTGTRAGAVVRLKSEPCYPSYQNDERGERYHGYHGSKSTRTTVETVEAVGGITGSTGSTVPETNIPDSSPAEGIRWIDEDTVEVF